MDSNELRLNNEITRTLKDLREHNQDRHPRNHKRRLELPFELKNAMQDRQWKSTEIREDLESIRKFSILNCIRERVFDVLSELPLLSIEYLCQQDIDGLIRRNLLRERKVRFNNDNEYEGEEKIPKTEEEIEKENILEEMDIVLKVLGNDRRNKLVIENFELLEERISRVEQRLSGLIRRLPVGKVSSEIVQSQIKIDVAHVRMDIENFVNKFNDVFSSDFEVLTGTSDFPQYPKHSVSSTNRLKFQMLSRLPETPITNALQDSCNADKKDVGKEKDATMNDEKNLPPGLGVDRTDSKTNQRDLKAVDSLISLRERFKSQSTKFLLMTGHNSYNSSEDPKKEVEVQVEEIFLTKDNTENTVDTEKTTENTESNVDPPPEYIERTDDSIMVPSTDQRMQEAVDHLKELNSLFKENKSVQTAPKKKKNNKSKSKRQKSQQTIDGKEVWVQYVNKKVLRFSKSSMDINDPIKHSKEPKATKEKPKVEKHPKKLKQPKVTNTPAIIKENIQFVDRAESKKDILSQKDEHGKEQVSTQFKEYKKIFLLKIPKTSSKQNFTNPPSKLNITQTPKKTESKILPVAKELPAPKKVSEKASKTKSLIRLFPKAFKSKSKEQKRIKEESSSKTITRTSASTDSQQKLNTNQFLYKIRSRWIYTADQNGRLLQKNYDEWAQTPPNSVTKNRKSTQKLKKKKSDGN